MVGQRQILCVGFGVVLYLAYATFAFADEPMLAKGLVFHDLNNNRTREAEEPGIAGVRVSNQRDVVVTGEDGRWQLPVLDDDTKFFVVKPRNWRTPVNHHNLPQFFYIHKPNGSPKLKYPGVSPTGTLPKSIDFPLYPSKEPNRFKAIFFGDPQPRTMEQVRYIAHDVIEELVGTDASFGVTLGDIVFDYLNLMEPLNASIALLGIPWYNVLGNHDINFDSTDDAHSDETFERVYGPNYYSFDHGPTHFIVLDNVDYHPDRKHNGRHYTGAFDAQQLAFVREDLKHVGNDQLVVLLMHIPLSDCPGKGELFRLIEERPYTLSVAAHQHYMEHKFLGKESGWRGAKPHHHVINVTVSGSWWKGFKDETGIPHATMTCGAPNGYSIFEFDGSGYTIAFKAARRPASYQMNIVAPDAIAQDVLPDTPVYINVFNGTVHSTVELRIGADSEWLPVDKVQGPDPLYVETREREKRVYKGRYRGLPEAMQSTHLWAGWLPTDLKPGTYMIEVRTTDMFGRSHSAHRVVEIKASATNSNTDQKPDSG